jgi:competence protein ComEA
VPDAPPSSPIEPFRPLPDPSWRERVDELVERARGLGRAARLSVAVIVASAAVAVAVITLRPVGADSRPEDTLPRASAAPPAVTASASPSSPAVLVVQAAGAIARPGVYRLPTGTRVDDLVRAAGGFAPDADPDRVNLAAVLTDGERVYIPRAGEAVSDVTGGGPTSASQPVDLNTATIDQLDTLPGVGPATAQAIIDYRSQHGRFRSVEDLLNVRGIGRTKLDEIRALVRV